MIIQFIHIETKLYLIYLMELDIYLNYFQVTPNLRLIKNLAYVWIVIHYETLSVISDACQF